MGCELFDHLPIQWLGWVAQKMAHFCEAYKGSIQR